MINLRAPNAADYGTKPAPHPDSHAALSSATDILAAVPSPDGMAMCFYADPPQGDASTTNVMPLSALTAKTHARALATARWRAGLADSLEIAASQCFEQSVFALTAVPMVALLADEIALDPDPGRIHVSVSHEGVLEHVWRQSDGRAGRLQACCLWLGRRIAAELVRYLPTFAALTACDAQSLARRASHVIGAIAGIGISAGLNVSRIHARYVSGMVLAAGSPVLHPAGADARPARRAYRTSIWPPNSR